MHKLCGFLAEGVLSVYGMCRSGNDYELIPTVKKMETRHSVGGSFGNDFFVDL